MEAALSKAARPDGLHRTMPAGAEIRRRPGLALPWAMSSSTVPSGR
jgi:hypothetical protein